MQRSMTFFASTPVGSLPLVASELVFPPRWEPRPPATLEGKPTKGPFYLTVNEIGSFLRCRRAWNISSQNGMGLSRTGTPTPALHIGACLHYAIGRQALGAEPLDAVREFFSASIARITQQYRQKVGTSPSFEELAVLDEQRLECLALIEAYFAHYGTENPIRPYRMLAPEVTFCVPLVEDYDLYLVGTLDGVCIDEMRNPVPLERKSYSRKPKRENWRFNHQMYGYSAALQLLTGKRVNFGLYDGIRKGTPTVPRTLKNGDVSLKWIDTTYDIYRNEVLRVHGGEVPNRYLDILNRLKERDLSPENAFFTRFRVPITQYSLEKWWTAARDVAMEAAHWPKLYPNFDWQGCPMCRVKDLCHAMQAGEDIDILIKEAYEPHHSPTIRTILSGTQPIAIPGAISRPSDFEKFGSVSLDYDPDPVMDVSTQGES